MEEQSREALLSQLCSNLKEELVNTRHKAALEIDALRKKLAAANAQQAKNTPAALSEEQISDAQQNERYLTGVIDELRASLKEMRLNSTGPAETEKLNARIALLEKSTKRQKDKGLKKDLVILQQAREITELRWLLGLKHPVEEDRTGRLASATAMQEEDMEAIAAWKEAFTTLRKHYEEAVAIASNTVREFAPELWFGKSPESDEDAAE